MVEHRAGSRVLVRTAGACLLLATAGCGLLGAAPAAAGPPVRNRTLNDLPLLVDATGHTLYLFAPDRQRAVTCVQTCQGNWPPLTTAAGATPRAVGEVDRHLLGSAANPDGGRVVTYNGWPLYTYAGDDGPGRLRGHARQLNGGVWYAITTSGAPA